MSCISKRRPGTVSFARYKLGLSQQQLADSLGVSRSLIAMVETGKRKLPRAIQAIYLSLCDKAAAINPEGAITIKRGRKPARPDFSVVTNYNSSTDKNGQQLFLAGLQRKKTTLNYLHMGLLFRKVAIEEQARRFSGQLTCVRAMLNLCTELLDKLPGGKTRDKYELNAAVFYAKQIKLTQQLKKCSPVVLVQIEYQMNILESQLIMTQEKIASLNNDQERSMSTVVPGTNISHKEDFFTEETEKDRHYSVMAA